MEIRKVLSGLCYFSIFFAGIIFPLIVFFATNDEVIKMHAKKSLLSHLVPLIPAVLLVFAVIKDAATLDDEIPVFFVISLVIFFITCIAVAIWNIVKGVKVLVAE